MRYAKMGDRARDEVTGFEGIVIQEMFFLNGCVHLNLKPSGLTPKKETIKSQNFDIQRVQIVEEQVIIPYPKMPARSGVSRGDLVRSGITDLEGVVIIETIDLSGAIQYTIEQVGLDEEGKLWPAYVMDEVGLIVVEKGKIKADPLQARPGDDISTGRPPGFSARMAGRE